MRILVLSFYYFPDLSAGSFRTTALIQALLNSDNKQVQIDVVTTLPNRYNSFISKAKEFENNNRLNIYRIKLPMHQCGMRDQSRAFLKFFREATSIVSSKEYDLVYATSSRLMTAVLGAWIATRQKALLYLDIRDIFVDTISSILPKKIAIFVKPIFSLLERWTINKANKVNLVSEGFKEYFVTRYPTQQFSYYTNGIDDEFIRASNISLSNQTENKPIKVLYAGNLGEGQGLHTIIPKLALKMQNRVKFVLIGDGGRKRQLEYNLNKTGCSNVEIREPIDRKKLIESYLEADVLFLHLNNYTAFRKVLPSKIFEYAALGKPIWAGVSGYAAQFVESEIENAVVFTPGDVNQASQVFESLKLTDIKRPGFVSKFSRMNIMKSMVDDVLSIK